MKAQDHKFSYKLRDSEVGLGASGAFERVFIQTPQMVRNYALYHDVVFMDATYSTNVHSMPLVVLSGVNNEGKNTVLGFGFLTNETMESYQWLLEQLVYVTKRAPRVLLTDFDASMAGAIERSLPETTHLLCQWHMM